MTRYGWLVVAIAVAAGASSFGAQGAQGAGQAGGRGGAAPQERVDWNAKMPWGAIEKAVQARWNGVPRTEQKPEPFKVFDNLYYVGIQHVAAYLVPTSEGLNVHRRVAGSNPARGATPQSLWFPSVNSK